jgi:hypothetical protein
VSPRMVEVRLGQAPTKASQDPTSGSSDSTSQSGGSSTRPTYASWATQIEPIGVRET